MRNFTALIAFILIATSPLRAGLKSGEPIPVGGDGQGALSIALRNSPVGAARLENEKHPALFVVAEEHGIGQTLYLFRRTGSSKEGTPVFGKRVTVKTPSAGKSVDIGGGEDGGGAGYRASRRSTSPRCAPTDHSATAESPGARQAEFISWTSNETISTSPPLTVSFIGTSRRGQLPAAR